MIRFGICAGPEKLNKAAEIGFDYLEISLSGLAAMNAEAYDELVKNVDDCAIRVEACNGMLPARVRVTGDEVSAPEQHQYLDHAFSRAKRLGVDVIVFGSAGARNVPKGFDYGLAYRQINNFLRIAHGHANDYHVRIAIEPLRRGESNILNLVSEANEMASLLQLPTVGVLGDTYHMEMNSEPFSVFSQAGRRLWHVHTANAIGRVMPREGDGEDYHAIFSALLEAEYDGRISIEAGGDFDRDAEGALRVLQKAYREVLGK